MEVDVKHHHPREGWLRSLNPASGFKHTSAQTPNLLADPLPPLRVSDNQGPQYRPQVVGFLLQGNTKDPQFKETAIFIGSGSTAGRVRDANTMVQQLSRSLEFSQVL